MAILTASQDLLRSDRLRDESDPLKEDYLGKDASKRIAIYDKEYGFAMQPEQKKVVDDWKVDVNERTGEIKNAQGKYDKDWNAAMDKANRSSNAILNQIKGQSYQEPKYVTVRVVNGNNVEGTYRVTRGTADKLNSEIFNKGDGSYVGNWVDDGVYNVDVNLRGGGSYGKELHEMMQEIVAETDRQVGESKATFNKARDIQERGAKSAINTQRETAQKDYNEMQRQFAEAIEQVHGPYAEYVKSNKQAFNTGIQTNSGGIKDLLASGALVPKKVKVNG